MKRFVTAILPLILIGQIPFHATNYVPSDWMKRFQYGLKWTELMMNGYPGAANATESVPEGVVTTTVTMASAIPEFEHIQKPIEEEFCNDDMNEKIETAGEEAFEIQIEWKEERVLEIRKAQVL